MIDELAVKEILKELSNTDYACFSSEAQLRDSFAIYLAKKYPNCTVYPEYTQPIPNGWRCSEKKKIFFDLLVEDKESNETILFEFKYKTSQGEFNLNKTSVYLSDNSDSTNGRYAIWRDIYRIETFANLNKITKGFIVFVTNNSSYCCQPQKGYAFDFSLAKGLHKAGNRSWIIPSGSSLIGISSIEKAYRRDLYPLITKNDYFFNYDDYSAIKDVSGKVRRFAQLVIPIHSETYNNKLNDALTKIGKKNFVKYYRLFETKDSAYCKKQLLSDGFTSNSADTTVNVSKRLFENHQNIEALRNIIASSKVDEVLRIQAITLL